jgi:hypothetical protein
MSAAAQPSSTPRAFASHVEQLEAAVAGRALHELERDAHAR